MGEIKGVRKFFGTTGSNYDNLDRLTCETYHDTLVDGFAMDDLGNRTGSETQRNTAHTYAVDSLTNRYTAIDADPLLQPPSV